MRVVCDRNKCFETTSFWPASQALKYSRNYYPQSIRSKDCRSDPHYFGEGKDEIGECRRKIYNFSFPAALAPCTDPQLTPRQLIRPEKLEWSHHFLISSGFLANATALCGFLWGQRVPPAPPALLKYRICKLRAESILKTICSST